jgi:hypothetical protein
VGGGGAGVGGDWEVDRGRDAVRGPGPYPVMDQILIFETMDMDQIFWMEYCSSYIGEKYKTINTQV